jgi:hypothetical protein
MFLLPARRPSALHPTQQRQAPGDTYAGTVARTWRENDMNRIYATLLAAPLLFATVMPASAQTLHRHHRHYRSSHYSGERPYHGHGIGPGKGALIGGAGGAVLGGALGGGKGALIGGALGAGGGALAGKAHQNHMKRDYYNGRPR